jgi:hypothetical protein
MLRLLHASPAEDSCIKAAGGIGILDISFTNKPGLSMLEVVTCMGIKIDQEPHSQSTVGTAVPVLFLRSGLVCFLRMPDLPGIQTCMGRSVHVQYPETDF